MTGKKRVGLYMVGLAALLMGGCIETLSDVEDTNSIFSARRDGQEFGDFLTYAMPNEVVDLSDLTDTPIEVPQSDRELVVQVTADNMEQRNFERVPWDDTSTLPTNADLVVIPGVVANENWVWGYTPGWCCGYWWWYPPTPVVISLPVGAIVLTIFDPNDIITDDMDRPVFQILWGAAMRGALDTTQPGQPNSTQRITDVIDQAFTQSPYLRSNGGGS